MSKESLFKLIRNEEVVLWAGAGLSIYAGYPSGNQLAHKIYNELATDEKSLVSQHLTLPLLAEEFCRIKGNNKNHLIGILNDIFNEKPLSSEYHDKIKKISHFKTIITTNYDKLFESSYGSSGQLIISKKHIPYIKNEKVQIYKIHGDLSDAESIILTNSDYINFFKTGSENDVFWTSVKEKITTKSVVFIGYNLEDPNISVIFDKITDTLGPHKREYFLICPDLPIHKVNDLLLKGIQYINCTGEKFIDELLNDVRDNIIEDFNNRYISPDTFRDFLSNFKLLPDLQATHNSFQIKGIRSTEPNTKGLFNFKFKEDAKFLNEWNDFLQGKTSNDFELSSKNLEEGRISVQGIKLFDFGNYNKIILSRKPKKCKIDIQFEDGYELYDIKTSIYSTLSNTTICVKLNSGEITFTIDQSSVSKDKFHINYKYEHNKFIKRVVDSRIFFEIVNKFGEGKKFKIYSKSKKILEKSFSQFKPILEDSEFILQYLKNLEIIEKVYDFKFSAINTEEIEEDTYELAKKIATIITDGEIISFSNPRLEMDLIDSYNKSYNLLKNLNDIDNQDLTFNSKKIEEVNLHGKIINLGYPSITIYSCYVENLSEQHNTVTMKSRINKSSITYRKLKSHIST